VVKPRDEASNKAQGPSQDEIERIEKMLMESANRPKLAGTGSNSLGSSTRYVTYAFPFIVFKNTYPSAAIPDFIAVLTIRSAGSPLATKMCSNR